MDTYTRDTETSSSDDNNVWRVYMLQPLYFYSIAKMSLTLKKIDGKWCFGVLCMTQAQKLHALAKYPNFVEKSKGFKGEFYRFISVMNS